MWKTTPPPQLHLCLRFSVYVSENISLDTTFLYKYRNSTFLLNGHNLGWINTVASYGRRQETARMMFSTFKKVGKHAERFWLTQYMSVTEGQTDSNISVAYTLYTALVAGLM